MFKNLKSAFVLTALLSTASASATSPHPCTATYQAKPTQLYCPTDGNHYTIVIETRMSPPIKMCQGNQHFEIHTAKVEISSGLNGSHTGNLTIENDDFSYKLSGGKNGHASFDSDRFGIHLDDCVTPVYGGMSIGN